MKFAKKLVLPLFRQIARRHDQTTLQIAAGDQLLDEQTGHDGFAGTRVVRKDVPQRQAWQHLLINCRDLVWQGLNSRSVDRQIRVKQVCQMDAVRFGYKAHLIGICAETPRQTVTQHIHGRLISTIEDLTAKLPSAVLECNFQCCIAIPLHRNNGHSFPCRNAVQLAADRDLLQMCHGSSFPNCPLRTCTFTDSQGFLHITTVYRETPANATISGKSSAKSHSSSTKGFMYSNQFEKVRFSEFSGSFIKWYFRISKPCCRRFQRGGHRLAQPALGSTVWHAMPCELHKSCPARGEVAYRISRPGL